MAQQTEAEIELTAHLEHLLGSSDKWRVVALVMSYETPEGEPRIAQGVAMSTALEHREGATLDMVKMIARFRGLADELEQTLMTLRQGGVAPLELRRKS